MAPWALRLDAACFDNARLVRSAGFTHPSGAQVAAVLANRAPANAADLAALMVDQLHGLVKRLRGSETSGLRLFWQPDGAGANQAKSENDCRDVLMERLSDRLLQLNVSLEREPSAAFEKRPDMRASAVVSGQRVRVPIEIKKDSHRHLWTAWRDQLDRLYAIDPAARGSGIYLVLWFGLNPRPTPEGDKPSGAKRLEELLDERMSAEGRHRLKVLVLDLSWPETATGRQRALQPGRRLQ